MKERMIVTIRCGRFSYGFERLGVGKRADHTKLAGAARWLDSTSRSCQQSALREIPEASSISAAFKALAVEIGDDADETELTFRAGYLVGQWEERFDSRVRDDIHVDMPPSNMGRT